MNFYKQLIISYFFVVLKNLILIFSKMISYVNKSFRTKFFLFSSVNDKSFEKFISLSNGTFNSFTFSFRDQNLNEIYARDPNVSITLIIRQKK